MSMEIGHECSWLLGSCPSWPCSQHTWSDLGHQGSWGLLMGRYWSFGESSIACHLHLLLSHLKLFWHVLNLLGILDSMNYLGTRCAYRVCIASCRCRCWCMTSARLGHIPGSKYQCSCHSLGVSIWPLELGTTWSGHLKWDFSSLYNR